MATAGRGAYRRRMRALITGQGPAYGFTLTVWGTGNLVPLVYGPLTVERVFLFVLGPLVMYAVLLLTLYRLCEPAEQPEVLQRTPFGFLDFLCVPLAVAAAYLVFSHIHNPFLGIPIGGFLGTLAYNLLLGLQLLVFRGRGGC